MPSCRASPDNLLLLLGLLIPLWASSRLLIVVQTVVGSQMWSERPFQLVKWRSISGSDLNDPVAPTQWPGGDQKSFALTP
eukprot:COSAG06_NODE_2374_length_6987_cov_3.378049_3_plen_80_part_00